MTQHKQKRSFGQVTGVTTAAVALTTIIFYLISEIWAIEVPGEVQGAFTTLIVAIAGYLVPPKDGAPHLEFHDKLD